MSSALGLGSPLGWLWATTTAAAPAYRAEVNTSRGWTGVLVQPAPETLGHADKLVLGPQVEHQKPFLGQVLHVAANDRRRVVGTVDHRLGRVVQAPLPHQPQPQQVNPARLLERGLNLFLHSSRPLRPGASCGTLEQAEKNSRGRPPEPGVPPHVQPQGSIRGGINAQPNKKPPRAAKDKGAIYAHP